MGLHSSLIVQPEAPSCDRAAPRGISLWAALLCVVVSGCFLPPPAEEKSLTDPLADQLADQQAEATVDATVDSTVGSPVEAAASESSPEPSSELATAAVAPAADSAPQLSSETSAALENLQGADEGMDPAEPSPAGSTLIGPDEVASASPEVAAPEGLASDSLGLDSLNGDGGLASAGSAADPGTAIAPGTSGGDARPSLSVSTGSSKAAADANETSVVEVQQSTVSDLKPVADAIETVAPALEGIDTQALERDPDVSQPMGVPGEITPKELQSTVAAALADSGDVASTSDRAGAIAPGAGPSALDAVGSVAAAGAAIEASATSVTDGFAVRQHETDDELLMTYEIGGPPARAVPTANAESGAINRATVVFIHGWCGNRGQWDIHMEALASGSVVLSVDLLGHGDSLGLLQPRDEWTIPRYGRDVAGVIEAEDLHDVILVGHAMGGQVALEVALRIPDRITGVIGVESLHELNVDAEGPLGTPGLKEYLEAFEDDFMKAFNDFIANAVFPDTQVPIRDRISRDAERCDKPVAIKLMRHFQTRDLKSVVRNIECPVRCINSGLLKTDVEGNRALLTGFAATEMAEVGFWPHLEKPESFQTELVLQIKEIQAPKRIPVDAEITGLLPVLFSDDVEALAKFYTERLQFDEVSRQPSSPDEPATFIALERDDWRLQIQSRASLASDVPGAEDVTRGGRLLFFTVTNLQEEREHLGTEVEMMVPLRNLDSGSQQTIFRDPQKNVIVLQQPPRRVPTAQE